MAEAADISPTGDFLLPGRDVPLGGVRGMTVNRTLPHRDLPTVGPWCFVDYFGPTREPMEVLPHPHTGLQTVTLPLRGHIRHKDSLGSDVVLRPGEVNLMTSGAGVSHSEFSVGDGPLNGVQLWVALPEDRRHGEADFEHHRELPTVRASNLEATVFMGRLTEHAESPVTTYSPMVGADVRLTAGGSTLAVDPQFEHAVMVLEGAMTVDSRPLPAAQMLYLRQGRESVAVAAQGDARFMLLGGEPLGEDLVMWWNFIGRTHDEIVTAREDWEASASRFGHVGGHEGLRIPAPPMPQVRIKPRRRQHA